MGGGYGWYLLQTLLALGVVCAAAYLVLRFVVRRAIPGARRGPVRILWRIPIEPKRSLLLVEAAGRCFLVGSSEGGLSLIAELDPARVAEEPKPASDA